MADTSANHPHSHLSTSIKPNHGTCPSCHQYSTFTYVGEQRWPPRVAEKRGVKVIMLWTCGVCGSTIDGQNITK